MRSVKARWATKLLRSKHFVVMTDKESVICFQGVDPNSFDDLLALMAQSSELQMFNDKLKELIRRHDKAIKKLKGEYAPTAKRKSVRTKKTIKVKQG